MSNLIFSVELDIPAGKMGDGSVPAVQRHSKKWLQQLMVLQ